jgi:hypothetical protein
MTPVGAVSPARSWSVLVTRGGWQAGVASSPLRWKRALESNAGEISGQGGGSWTEGECRSRLSRDARCYSSHVTVNDTTAEAAAVQLELYRAVESSGRVSIAVELSDAARETTVAGIRRRHSEYSDDAVACAFLTLVYGHAKKGL